MPSHSHPPSFLLFHTHTHLHSNEASAVDAEQLYNETVAYDLQLDQERRKNEQGPLRLPRGVREVEQGHYEYWHPRTGEFCWRFVGLFYGDAALPVENGSTGLSVSFAGSPRFDDSAGGEGTETGEDAAEDGRLDGSLDGLGVVVGEGGVVVVEPEQEHESEQGTEALEKLAMDLLVIQSAPSSVDPQGLFRIAFQLLEQAWARLTPEQQQQHEGNLATYAYYQLYRETSAAAAAEEEGVGASSIGFEGGLAAHLSEVRGEEANGQGEKGMEEGEEEDEGSDGEEGEEEDQDSEGEGGEGEEGSGESDSDDEEEEEEELIEWAEVEVESEEDEDSEYEQEGEGEVSSLVMAQQPAYLSFDEYAYLIQPHLAQIRALNFNCPLDSIHHPYHTGLYDQHAPMGVGMAPYVFAGGGVLHLSEEMLRLRVDLERYDNLGREPSRSLLREMNLGGGGYSTVTMGGWRLGYLKEVAFKSTDLSCLDVSNASYLQNEHLARSAIHEVMLLKFMRLHDVPNVATILGATVHHAHLIVALEWARKGTLRSLIGKVDRKQLRKYAVQIMTIIEDLHARGIVHRDLKPENLLLDDDNSVRATDFNSAKWKKEGGPVGVMEDKAGTVGYMAPEVFCGDPYTYSCDLFSLGKTLVVLVFGDGVIYAPTPMVMEGMKKWGLPPGGRKVLEGLLSFYPEERPSLEVLEATWEEEEEEEEEEGVVGA